MKANPKKFRLIILIVALCLIAAVTLAFNMGFIKLNPQYQAVNSQTPGNTPAVSGEPSMSPSVSAQPTAHFPSGISMVSVVQAKTAKAEDIQYEEIKMMVTDAVNMAGGFEGLIKNNMTVVIKPNLVTPIDYTLPGWKGKPLAPEVNGTTTDYRVARAIVELVRQHNPDGKVYIMEGSAFPTKECMLQLNYTPEYIPGVDEFIAIEEDSGKWRDYDSPGIVKVPVSGGLLVDEVYMNKKYKEADIVISVPVLKTHWTEVVSGSVKNVGIGATPATIYGGTQYMSLNRTGSLDHDKTKLDKWIHDFFAARPVDFAIIEGLQGIQNGPTPCFDQTGTSDIKMDQMNTRVIVASRDCVAADTIESLIMEWDPAAVGYLGHLENSGLGNCDVSNIRVIGKQVDEVRKDFKGTAPEGKFTDLAAPEVTINKTEMTADGLSVQMAVSADTAKVEVYMNGQYVMTDIPKDPGNYTLLIKGVKESDPTNDIVIEVYDKYLNRTDSRLETAKK